MSVVRVVGHEIGKTWFIGHDIQVFDDLKDLFVEEVLKLDLYIGHPCGGQGKLGTRSQTYGRLLIPAQIDARQASAFLVLFEKSKEGAGLPWASRIFHVKSWAVFHIVCTSFSTALGISDPLT